MMALSFRYIIDEDNDVFSQVNMNKLLRHSVNSDKVGFGFRNFDCNTWMRESDVYFRNACDVTPRHRPHPTTSTHPNPMGLLPDT